MLYEVTITKGSLGGVAPANGFVDPSSVENYYQRVTYTGTATSPTMVATDTFNIGDTPIIAGGANLAAVVTAINAKSHIHHFKAVASSNKLQLTTLPGFDRLIPSITDITTGVTTKLGFTKPDIGAKPNLPSTIEISEQKERGNQRWLYVLESLQLTSNVWVQVTDAAGGDITTDPTTVKFLLDIPSDFYHYDFSGNVVYAESAVRHAIAKALMYTAERLVYLYDPTDSDPSTDHTIPYGTKMQRLLVGPLTSTSSDALAAVTLTLK